MNIFEKLSSITNELTAVAKNLNVGVGSSSYKAVSEGDVLAAVKPLENKYKVYSYPISRRIVESGTIENESIDYKTQQKVIKRQLFERIETIYRFVNIEKPDEYIDIVSYGDGIDSQDKSVGKAMTYADKYALLKAYKIITGDDPDQKASEPLASSQIKEVKEPLDQTVLAKLQTEFNYDINKICSAFKNKTPETLTTVDLNRLYERLVLRKKQLEEQQANGNNNIQ